MDQHIIITLILFLGFFLVTVALLQNFTAKFSFPFTVSLLLAGFLSQFFFKFLQINTHIVLTPEIIFYLLLPLLLFESAFHINFHQFKLQFKTITFLASFGLLVSVFVVGFGGAYFLGLPFEVALLFGALISATDPIAVIALFKSLGAPKRLTLIADGESMFNDATGVIAFKIISIFALAGQSFQISKVLEGTGNFILVFIGSMVFGSIIGYVTSHLIAKLREESLIQTTLTIAAALFSFVAAEHFFHLSGVITTVMAGFLVGNLSKTKISQETIHFVKHMWEYIAFLCISFVFFFAAFNLNFAIFTKDPNNLFIIILLVLIARAISVYLSCFLTNKLSIFKNEPNIPLVWQHILNWGGLRGVIPLVLVYSLPDTFIYKEQFLAFTLSTLVFTLLVNGLSIKWLLLKLKLHLPKKSEQIISDEMYIFELKTAREALRSLPTREFDQQIIQNIDNKLVEQIEKFRKHLLALAKKEEFLHSLKIQAIEIERNTMDRLFSQGRFTENVYFEFESMLDMQRDVLEYPEISKPNLPNGVVDSRKAFRRRIINLRRRLTQYPIFKKLLNEQFEDIVKERYGLLRARLFTSYAVLDYLENVQTLFSDKIRIEAILEVKNQQLKFIKNNLKQVKEIAREYPNIVSQYQLNVIYSILDRTILSQNFHKMFISNQEGSINQLPDNADTKIPLDKPFMPLHLSKLIS